MGVSGVIYVEPSSDNAGRDRPGFFMLGLHVTRLRDAKAVSWKAFELSLRVCQLGLAHLVHPNSPLSAALQLDIPNQNFLV